MILLDVLGGRRGCSSSPPPDSDNAGKRDSNLPPPGEAATERASILGRTILRVWGEVG